MSSNQFQTFTALENVRFRTLNRPVDVICKNFTALIIVSWRQLHKTIVSLAIFLERHDERNFLYNTMRDLCTICWKFLLQTGPRQFLACHLRIKILIHLSIKMSIELIKIDLKFKTIVFLLVFLYFFSDALE